MTHQIYSHQQLHLKSTARLKQIYSEIGCTVEVSDRRCKDAWISAIADYQASKIQKVAPVVPNEQATAQAELDHYITTQAQAVAPEELRTVEISFYDHEYYCGDKLIAAITHDDNDFVTQRWVVMVNGVEIHRAATPMLCDRYIRIHYKDSSLPVQEQNATATTGNEIMAQIFNECEKYGLELLDDGIYTSDGVKLGEVGCTNGVWWVIRAFSVEQKVVCESVESAVRRCKAVCRETSLSIVKPVDWQELLDKPFDQLSTQEWLLVMESEPVQELVAA
ncbi:hypothetical protein GS682_28980 [Nostoc sp. B(2019)]|nr:hypothetical protein [Nostoc sp. B(2019)]